jgi:D-3-phosphoglycerate dehydrogenase
MPAQSVFVNTARGELVDEDALRDSIASGHLAGAGLDVLRSEEAGANPFADLPQVIVTPHYAGATRGAQARILRVGLTNVLRVLAGQRPDYLLVEGRRA